MFVDYMKAALKLAHYEYLTEDKIFYGEIPLLRGIMATGETLEDCREELKEVLEEWLILSLQFNDPIPELEGIIFKSKPLVNA